MIDDELRTFLLADATLLALLADSNSIYPVRLPQDALKPCIVYSIHDGIAKVQVGSTADIRRYSVTLRTISDTYGPSRIIGERIQVLLNGLSTVLTTSKIVSANVHNVLSDSNDTSEYYSSIIDTTIHIRD